MNCRRSGLSHASSQWNQKPRRPVTRRIIPPIYATKTLINQKVWWRWGQDASTLLGRVSPDESKVRKRGKVESRYRFKQNSNGDWFKFNLDVLSNYRLHFFYDKCLFVNCGWFLVQPRALTVVSRRSAFLLLLIFVESLFWESLKDGAISSASVMRFIMGYPQIFILEVTRSTIQVCVARQRREIFCLFSLFKFEQRRYRRFELLNERVNGLVGG